MPKLDSSTEIAAEIGKVLDGTMTAREIKEELAKELEGFKQKGLRAPGLAVILVGDNPASQVYVKNKVLACKKCGIDSRLETLPASTPEPELLELIDRLNKNDSIDGILVQLPLPDGFNTEKILEAVDPAKDVDGLHTINMGLLLAGKKGLRPCTPKGIIVLLERYGIEVAGKNALVVGRSNLVGKPIAIMLLEKNATVQVCHSKSRELDQLCRQADILIVAAGRKEMVKSSWIKKGAVVIDVGIHKEQNADGNSRLCGDVDYEEARQMASYITPVPGGVGPMTVAMLLVNTVESFKSKI